MDTADAQEIRLPVQMHYEQQKCVCNIKGSLGNVGFFLIEAKTRNTKQWPV